MNEQQVIKVLKNSPAEDDNTTKYGGTGLGLPITKQLTEMMGGRRNGHRIRVPRSFEEAGEIRWSTTGVGNR